jgi:hypothetical protein
MPWVKRKHRKKIFSNFRLRGRTDTGKRLLIIRFALITFCFIFVILLVTVSTIYF